MTVTIGRRELLVALGGTAAAWQLVAGAQDKGGPNLGGSYADTGGFRHVRRFT
jgi:hypothetical protein